MDLDEKDERAVEIEQRMKAPLEWDTPPTCKIKDLHESHYDETLRLIKHHFFREEPMCMASSLLQDQLSVKEYLDVIRTWMKDTTSLVALSPVSGRVIGTAITRICTGSEKTDTYERVQIFEGKTLKRIMHLQNTLIKETDVYEKFGHDNYLRIYILCVHPSYREKEIDITLLAVCMQVAITLKMPAIGGVFTSGASQSLARSVGYEMLWEIRYNQWIIDDHVVFDDPGRGNYSAAFMGQLVSLEEESKDEPAVSTDAVGTK
ncbi:uncharacterized protein LOC143182736 [Calliopsis andreniformis]|uniref:uncharacterized protein LOC143182736 n=1 Tax=Calliopsis andreniformis TaxID=337506 RepID=UPI003FCE9497